MSEATAEALTRPPWEPRRTARSARRKRRRLHFGARRGEAGARPSPPRGAPRRAPPAPLPPGPRLWPPRAERAFGACPTSPSRGSPSRPSAASPILSPHVGHRPPSAPRRTRQLTPVRPRSRVPLPPWVTAGGERSQGGGTSKPRRSLGTAPRADAPVPGADGSDGLRPETPVSAQRGHAARAASEAPREGLCGARRQPAAVTGAPWGREGKRAPRPERRRAASRAAGRRASSSDGATSRGERVRQGNGGRRHDPSAQGHAVAWGRG